MTFLLAWVLVQDVEEVKKGDLTLAVDAEGVFEAVDPFEVRMRLKAYAGELTIVSAAACGEPVRQGDVLLQLDAADLRKQIEAAESDLKLARAALAKSEKEATLQERADALAREAAELEVKNGEAAVKYWESTDGPGLLKTLELALLMSRDGVADQQEELDQLRKMYKSEELTNETSEIVVKRAVRALERSRERLKIEEASVKKQKEFDYPNAARKVTQALDAAKLALDLLLNAQALGKAMRESEAFKSRAAVAQAEEHLGKLKVDFDALTVKAPFDGVVWTSADPKTLRAGEKVQAQTVLMTLCRPGELELSVDLPESQLFWVRAGLKAAVSPATAPESVMEGTARAPSAVRSAAQNFPMVVDLPAVDARFVPGMKASIHVEIETLRGVLTVPATAVSHGRVWVRSGDVDEERKVAIGKSNGTRTEIKSGLAEGEQVLVTAKK